MKNSLRIKLAIAAILITASSFGQIVEDTCLTAYHGPVGMTINEFKDVTNNKDKLVLINFSADWCVVCKKQKPILDQIRCENKDKVEVVIIDMDDNPLIAEYFNVDGLPISLIYKKGEMLWDRMGLQQKNELLQVIKLLSKK